MKNTSNKLTAPILLSVITLFANFAFAQPGNTIFRSITPSIGTIHYRFIDEAFAHQRARFTGLAFASALNYQKRTDHFMAEATFNSAFGDATATGEWPHANFAHVHLSISYAQHALTHPLFGTSGNLYLGARLASTNYVIENVDGHDDVSITLSHTLNIFAFHETKISSRNKLEVSVSLPVAGLFKRTNYDGGINLDLEEQYRDGVMHLIFDGTRFSFISPARLPQLRIDFVRTLRPKTDLFIGYKFDYLKNTTVAPIALYSNMLTAGFRFNFNKIV